jgi:adenylate cyclase
VPDDQTVVQILMMLRMFPVQLIVSVIVLSAGVVLRVADPVPVAQLRLSIFDSYLRFSPRIADASFPVKIVAIDEASLDRFGQWPWPRTKLADLVTALAKSGAATITLDLMLSEPDRLSANEIVRALPDQEALQPLVAAIAQRPSNDQRLAEALSAAPVIMGVVGDSSGTQGLPPPRVSISYAGDDPSASVNSFTGGVTNLPLLSSAAIGIGAVNWLPSQDQILRRVPLLVAISGKLYPSLALEAFRVGSAQSTIFVKSSGGSGVPAFGQRTGIESLRVGDKILHSDARGELWLKYAARDSRRTISAGRILDGDFEVNNIQHRHIFIGATAAGLLDQRATPLDPSVPGVEIHAQALEQMLADDHLTRPSYATGMEIAFLVVAGVVVAWLVARSGAVAGAAIAVGATAAIITASWLAFNRAGVLIDPVFPAISVASVYLSTSLTSYVRSEVERAQIRAAFTHYLAPELVAELANNPQRLKLGGERREVTLLFMDVRGFTAIAESLDAEALVRLINRIFTPITDTILSHRGTIDKYMGDAVMAFWNAPLPDGKHAKNACRAALSMRQQLVELNRAFAVEAEARGEAPEPIRIGIGINTGSCVVGNVGSPQRFDYSVIGDPVNVAARFQNATKIYGADIIIGEQTAAAARGFAVLELATVTPRGKGRPERIFALLGDDTLNSSAQFSSLAAKHAMLLAAIRDGHHDKAASALCECLELNVPGTAEIYRRFTDLLNADSGK